MGVEIVWLLAGALVSLVISEMYRRLPSAARTAQISRQINRRRTDRAASATNLRILRYFERHGLQENLYCTQSLTPSRVPILVDSRFRLHSDVNLDQELHVDFASTSRDNLPIDAKVIRDRQRGGARLWDGESVYIKGHEMQEDGTTRLKVARCNYFAYATLSARLQAEVWNRRSSTPLLDSQYQSLAGVLEPHEHPVVLGCTCVCVFHVGGRRLVPIQHRSYEVLNNPGVDATIPIFGVESHFVGGQPSSFSLLFHNFGREFLEELLGLPDLVKATTEGHLHPDWFWSIDHGKVLLEQARSGSLRLQVGQLAADPHDGRAFAVLVAEFRDEHFFDQLSRSARPSFESAASSPGGSPIEIYDLDSQELEARAVLGLMDPSSIMALDQARLLADASSAPS